MTDPKDNDLQKQKEEYQKVAQDTFNAILAAYRCVVDEISDDCLEDLNKIMQKKLHKNIENSGKAFKENLFESIKDAFAKCWKDREMNCNVAILEMSKRHFMSEEKWRPGKKTVDEQLKPHLIKALQKERDYLKSQNEAQKEKIAKFIPIIEKNRKILSERMQRRTEIMAEIDKDIMKIEECSTKVCGVLDEIHTMDLNRVDA